MGSPPAHMTLTFNVNEDRYEDIIRQIRDVLTHSESHGIPVLRPQQRETAENALWLDILLVAGDQSITLRLEQTNLYVRGYRRSTDNFFWEFSEKKKDEDKDKDTRLILGSRGLTFTAGYVGSNSMVGRADILRENLPLGRTQLENAIIRLANMEDPLARGSNNQQAAHGSNNQRAAHGSNNQQAAHHILVMAQMIAEAARFRPIEEHIRAHWDSGVMLDGRMVDLENGWGQLSTGVLQGDQNPVDNTPLPNIPDINPTHVYTFGQAVAALAILLIERNRGRGDHTRHKRESLDDYDYGRCLMNLDYVRVNDIDGEAPGNLFGTVTVDDGWFTYTFYDRSSGDYEDVGPREFATLTDPSQPHAVSAADSFVVTVDLFDRDTFSPNDKIAQGEIAWDRSVESVTFADYDKHLYRVVEGYYGSVTVGYTVLSNALSVTIQVLLTDDDDEDPAEVYGTLAAYQILGGDDGSAQMILFNKSSTERVEVEKGQPIPLTRTVMAASTSTGLTISANLRDHDDNIANGRVDFMVQPGTQEEFIKGRHGQVQVIITCE